MDIVIQDSQHWLQWFVCCLWALSRIQNIRCKIERHIRINVQPALTSKESFRQKWIHLLSQQTIHTEIFIDFPSDSFGVPACIKEYQFVLQGTGLHYRVPVCTTGYEFVLQSTSLCYRVPVCTKTIVNHLHREVARIISEVVCWWPCHSSYIFTYFDWILPKTHKSIRNGEIDNPKMKPKLRPITTRRILNVLKHSLESVYSSRPWEMYLQIPRRALQ